MRPRLENIDESRGSVAWVEQLVALLRTHDVRSVRLERIGDAFTGHVELERSQLEHLHAAPGARTLEYGKTSEVSLRVVRGASSVETGVGPSMDVELRARRSVEAA